MKENLYIHCVRTSFSCYYNLEERYRQHRSQIGSWAELHIVTAASTRKHALYLTFIGKNWVEILIMIKEALRSMLHEFSRFYMKDLSDIAFANSYTVYFFYSFSISFLLSDMLSLQTHPGLTICMKKDLHWFKILSRVFVQLEQRNSVLLPEKYMNYRRDLEGAYWT